MTKTELEEHDVAARYREEWDADDNYLIDMPALLSAEQLAEPLVQALYRFFNGVGREDRSHLLAKWVERAEFDDTVDLDEARAALREYSDTVESAARLVRAAVSRLTSRAPVPVVGAVDAVLREIAGVNLVEHVLHDSTVKSMFAATEPR
jgi:hypothetical protein